jgi:MFS family permease
MSETKQLSKRERTLFVWMLLLTSFSFSISQSAMTTIYPVMASHFSVPISMVQWLTTGFMLVMTVTMPLSPWILNRVPFKWFLAGIQAMFLLGTFIAINATGFGWVIFGRVLEGAAVGFLFPSYQSVIMLITPEENRGASMGMVGLVMGAALATGPIVSGIISQWFNWQGVFVFFELVIGVLFLVNLFVGQNVIVKKEVHLDIPSLIGLFGFAMVLFGIQSLGHTTTPISMIAMMMIGLVLSVYFVHRQGIMAQPMLDFKVFKQAGFTFGLHNAVLAVIFAAFGEVGNAFMMLPATTYANNQLPDYLITHGSAMISTARQFAGVVGVLVATTIVSGFGNGLHSAYIVFALGMAVMSMIVWRITASYQRAK